MLETGVRIAEPGYRTVCYVEREVYAAATLVARMEEQAVCEAPVWDDLATFDGASWRGVVDIVVAGFPCPPASVAGQRKGVADHRWIWPDIVRIVRDVGPGWVFLENVRGLLSVNAGWAFHQVLRDLAGFGFDIEWGVLGARDVGATHRRERLFVLAHAKGERRGEQEYAERSEPWRDPWQDAGGRGDDLADAEHDGRVEPDLHARQRGSGKGTAVACWSELGLPHSPPGPGDTEGWRAVLEDAPHLEPAVCRMADGMAGGLDQRARAYEFDVPTPEEYLRHALAFRVDRLRLCGNGVHPLAAAYAFHALKSRFGD